MPQANDWTVTFTDLPKYGASGEITYTPTAARVNSYTYEAGGSGENRTLTMKYFDQNETVDLTGTVIWDDNNDAAGMRPNFINLRLYADDTIALNGALQYVARPDPDNGTWTYQYNNLIRYDTFYGHEIVYTIHQSGSKLGYTAETDGMTLTMKYDPNAVYEDVTVRIVWDCNADRIPDKISCSIEGGNGSWSTNLIKANYSGTTWDITTWTFSSSPSDWKFITNVPPYLQEGPLPGLTHSDSYDPDTNVWTITFVNNETVKYDIPVSVTWNDGDNQDGIRPTSLALKTTAGTTETQGTVTAANDWKHEGFKNVSKYSDKDTRITYSVALAGDAPDGYTCEINGDMDKGFTVVMTHIPETTSVSGQISWVGDDGTNIRPMRVTVKLLKDGQQHDVETVFEEDSWIYSFSDLPKYESGKEITYTITVDGGKKYTPSYTGYDATLTHTHTGGTATCGSKAVCAQCQLTYGDFDSSNHDYGTPTYAWATDNSSCTAERVCRHNSSHVETDNGTVTKQITQTANCTKAELTTYTATFTKSAFETQTKTNETKVALPHNYTYTAEGAVITESCDQGCHHTATATVSAPFGTLTYDGTTAFNAAVTYGDGWQGGTLDITYTKNGSAAADTTGAGAYVASITKNGASATVSYTVAKATFSVAATGYDGIYDGQPHSITATAAGATITYSTNGTVYSSDKPTFTDAGEYIVYYKAVMANHNDVLGSVTVKIAKATPVLTITPSSASLRGGSKVELTVTGAPAEGTYAITCDPAIAANADGSYTFPNKKQVYTFTVSYIESANYNAATASCQVSVSLYIPYIPNYYALTFETNGGSAIRDVAKVSGGTIDLLDYITIREGFTFTGWYADEELTEKITSVKLTKNTTVYAGWEEIGAPVGNPFKDIFEDDWYYDDVMYVYENGLMNGIETDLFSPAMTTTRGMIVTILWRLEGEPTVTYTGKLLDVPQNMYYAPAVDWAAANDILTGYGDGKYGPEDPLTREQMATILWRYAKYKGIDVSVGEDTNILSYNDAFAISDCAITAMQWVCGEGILGGYDGYLFPTGNAKRCEVAAILHRFCELIEK